MIDLLILCTVLFPSPPPLNELIQAALPFSVSELSHMVQFSRRILGLKWIGVTAEDIDGGNVSKYRYYISCVESAERLLNCNRVGTREGEGACA